MAAQEKAPLTHRLNAGICLINDKGEIFTALRKGYHPHSDGWQMPQGGIDKGENPLKAAKRELFEETGIPENHLTFIAECEEWLFYDFPPNLKNKMQSLGQKQKWFCFKYTGDGNIDLTQAIDHEFDAWDWRKPEDVLNRVVDFKREVYGKVLSKFHPHFS